MYGINFQAKKTAQFSILKIELATYPVIDAYYVDLSSKLPFFTNEKHLLPGIVLTLILHQLDCYVLNAWYIFCSHHKSHKSALFLQQLTIHFL